MAQSKRFFKLNTFNTAKSFDETIQSVAGLTIGEHNGTNCNFTLRSNIPQSHARFYSCEDDDSNPAPLAPKEYISGAEVLQGPQDNRIENNGQPARRPTLYPNGEVGDLPRPPRPESVVGTIKRITLTPTQQHQGEGQSLGK